MIISATEIIQQLFGKLQDQIFQNLAYETVTSALGKLYAVAEAYKEKFDAYLFIIKNMAKLSSTIMELGIDFLIKEQELDFSETKSIFLNILQGQVAPNFSIREITPDNILNYTASFFNFIYQGLPKLNEFTIDLKQNIVSQIKTIYQNLNQDMTFIMSKHLIDFIRKYQAIQSQLSCIQQEAAKEGDTAQTQPEKGDSSLDAQPAQQAPQGQQTLEKPQTPSLKRTKSLQSLEAELKELLDKEIVQKTYYQFKEILQEMSQEMVEKMKNYLDEKYYNKLITYVNGIYENCLEFLGQFYIIVSKHFSNAEYEQFKFDSIDYFKEQFKSINVYDVEQHE